MTLLKNNMQELTVIMSLSAADAKAVFTKSIASVSERGVTASCICQSLASQSRFRSLVKRRAGKGKRTYFKYPI